MPSNITARLILVLLCILTGTSKDSAAINLTCGPPSPCENIFGQYDLIFKGKILERGEPTEEEKENYVHRHVKKQWNVVPPKVYTDIKIEKIVKGTDIGSFRTYSIVHYDIISSGSGYFFVKNKKGYFEISYVGDSCGYGCDAQDREMIERYGLKQDKLRATATNYQNILPVQKKVLQKALANNDRYLAMQAYEAILNIYKKSWFKWPGAEDQYKLDYSWILKDFGQCEKALDVLATYGGRDDTANMIKLECYRWLRRTPPSTHIQISMRGRSIEDTIFENADMSGSDFRNSTLKNVTFKNVILKDSDFKGAYFSGVKIINSDLRNSNFNESDLHFYSESSNFDDVTFINAELTAKIEDGGTSFKRTDFTASKSTFIMRENKAQMTGAIFDDALIAEANESVLQGESFEQTKFRHINFQLIKNTNSLSFSNKNLDGVHFYSSHLRNISFENSNLTEANFTDNTFINVNFKNAILHKATFVNKDKLRPQLFSGTDFSEADISNAEIKKGVYDCAAKFPKGFIPEDNAMVKSYGGCHLNRKQAQDEAERLKAFDKNVHYAIFRDSDLSGVSFDLLANKGKNYKHLVTPEMSMIFINSDVTGASFKYGHGSIKSIGSVFNGADFSYSNHRYYFEQDTPMKGAKFHCARMSILPQQNIHYDQIDMTGVIFSEKYKTNWPYRYMPFNPIERKVFFENMPKVIEKFGAADYSDLDLRDCDLKWYDLAGVILPKDKMFTKIPD